MYSEETMQRMALLKTAREQLNNQYIQERAAAFAQWSTDCDRVWKESGIKLPFPPPGPVPTESDIVAYALALYNAQNPQSATPAPVTTPPVHTVVESVPISTPTIVTQQPVHEEPVVLPVPVVATIEPATVTPATLVAADTLVVDAAPVATIPELVTPVVTPFVTLPGAADLVAGETAIKEIFNKPSSDPAMALETQPTRSVAPLIETMRKKGLLPWWVKSGDATEVKE